MQLYTWQSTICAFCFHFGQLMCMFMSFCQLLLESVAEIINTYTTDFKLDRETLSFHLKRTLTTRIDGDLSIAKIERDFNTIYNHMQMSIFLILPPRKGRILNIWLLNNNYLFPLKRNFNCNNLTQDLYPGW